MLELVDVHAAYGDIDVLRGVKLEVREGEVVALLGRNGMGKTTTVRAITGLTPARAGSVVAFGHDLRAAKPHQIARFGIAVVPQGRRIFGSLSVRENLTLVARGGGGEGSWDLARVWELFPILEERSAVRGTLLSGGEQQMLAIARALMTNPRLLLLDEPSEGLAPMVIEHIATVIGELASSSLSILLVEQNLGLALDLSSRVYVMSNGRIVHSGGTAELAADARAKERLLGVSAVIAG